MDIITILLCCRALVNRMWPVDGLGTFNLTVQGHGYAQSRGIGSLLLTAYNNHWTVKTKPDDWYGQLKAKKNIEFQGSRLSANLRDAIRRQSRGLQTPCSNHLAVSCIVAETRDPWNSNFFRPLMHHAWALGEHSKK